VKASPSLTARSLGNVDDGPLRAVVAAWGNSGRSGIGRANLGEELKTEILKAEIERAGG